MLLSQDVITLKYFILGAHRRLCKNIQNGLFTFGTGYCWIVKLIKYTEKGAKNWTKALLLDIMKKINKIQIYTLTIKVYRVIIIQKIIREVVYLWNLKMDICFM